MMAAAANTGLKLNMFVTPCRIPIEHLLQNLNVAIRGKFRKCGLRNCHDWYSQAVAGEASNEVSGKSGRSNAKITYCLSD
jgi:hypothetical protein